MSVFEELGVCPELIRVADEHWLLPTPVQAEAVPLILGGGDVLAAAETGSGKTGAFGVPILQIVHESLRDAAATSARAAAASDGAASSASSAADARMSVEDRNALFAVASTVASSRRAARSSGPAAARTSASSPASTTTSW